MAKVALPSLATIMEFMNIVEEKYPALQHVWCVMDGLKVPIERPGHYRKMAGSMDILLVVSLFLFQMALLLLHQSTIPDLGTIALSQKIVAHIINLSKYIMILVEEVLLIQPSP